MQVLPSVGLAEAQAGLVVSCTLGRRRVWNPWAGALRGGDDKRLLRACAFAGRRLGPSRTSTLGGLGWACAWGRCRPGGCAGEGARSDALQLLERAEVAAQAGLPRPFVGQSVRLFVAFNANVGRDPLDEHMSVRERAVVQSAHRVYERAVGARFVVFGDGEGCVRAVSE